MLTFTFQGHVSESESDDSGLEVSLDNVSRYHVVFFVQRFLAKYGMFWPDPITTHAHLKIKFKTGKFSRKVAFLFVYGRVNSQT